MNKTLGQIAYEAYCEFIGWKPEWEDQPEVLQIAWEVWARRNFRSFCLRNVPRSD
jgi:hypothetical protein